MQAEASQSKHCSSGSVAVYFAKAKADTGTDPVGSPSLFRSGCRSQTRLRTSRCVGEEPVLSAHYKNRMTT